MADELTSLPVQSPLRITVRPYQGEMGDPNPYDFSTYLNSLPVEDPNQFQQIAPSGVGITRLPVKVEDAIRQAATENWVSRMIKSGVTLPKDVYEGKVDPLSEEGIERTQDLAGLNAAGPLAMKPGTATLGSGMMNMRMRKLEENLKIDDPGYVYHATNIERAHDIAESGKLKTHKPWEGTEQNNWPDGSVEKRNYFATGNPWAFSPEEGMPVLLRVKKDAHEFQIEKYTGDIYSKKPIPANKIEYLNDEGKWVSLLAEGGKVGAPLSALEKAPPFYSAVENAVKNAKQNSATVDQWLGFLKNQPGVKPEELQYTLKDLPKGQISKADLERHIAENKVQLKEIVKSSDQKKSKEQLIQEARNRGYTQAEAEEYAANPERLANTYPVEQTKYHSYQLPGGENYKETLLTFSGIPGAQSKIQAKQRQIQRDLKSIRETKGINDPEYIAKTEEYGKLDEQLNELMMKNEDIGQQEYKSSHWDEPNVLAHIRHNDRFIPDPNGPSINNKLANPKGWHITPPDQTTAGDWMVKSNDYSSKGFHFKTKEEAEANLKQQIEGERPGGLRIGDKGLKTLHIEEIQSDWHQAGRKQGYKATEAEKAAMQKELDDIEKNYKPLTSLPEGYELIKDGDKFGVIPPGQIHAQPYARLQNSEEAAIAAALDKLNSVKLYEMRQSLIDKFNKRTYDAVPDAPFKKTWDELALKRMIRQAAEQGYDAISWTPGEAQAARYDLSKQISKLEYQDGRLYGYDHNHRQVVNEEVGPTAPELEKYIGKEPAEKLAKQIENHEKSKEYERNEWSTEKNEETGRWEIYDPNGDVHYEYGGETKSFKTEAGANRYIDELLKEEAERSDTTHPNISGLDLKVGGEGMKAFYDKMLVDKANAIAKKFGGKVETVKLSPGRESKTGSGDFVKDEKPVHVLRITPELRQHALSKGFPLFSSGLPTLTPVDHDPFKPKLVPINYNPFENPNAT